MYARGRGDKKFVAFIISSTYAGALQRLQSFILVAAMSADGKTVHRHNVYDVP